MVPSAVAVAVAVAVTVTVTAMGDRHGSRECWRDPPTEVIEPELLGLTSFRPTDQLQPKIPKVIWLTMPCPVRASVRTPTTKPIIAVRPLGGSARSSRSFRICSAAAFWNQSSLGVEEAIVQQKDCEILSPL